MDVMSSDVLPPWMFCLLDVLSAGCFVCWLFCLLAVLSAGRFVRLDFLSSETFCPSRRFVSGRFFWAPGDLMTSPG
jgi:hypothetical protein